MTRTRTFLPSVSRIALAIASLAAALHASGATFLSLASRIAAEQQVPGDAGEIQSTSAVRPKPVCGWQKATAGAHHTATTAHYLVADLGGQSELTAPEASVRFDVRERADARQIRLSSVWLRAGPRSA